MEPGRWQQIEQLFHSALERDLPERAAFLTQACTGDEGLRREVESLIGSHEESDGFIENPAADIAAGLLAGRKTALTAGETVGPYRIESLLGAGGMGEVYLAQDVRLGRPVALKRLPAQFTLDADRVRRFGQEARAVSALNHPNIVTIHEIGESNSLHFITTEFIDGETLREHLARKQLNLDEVLDIATQIASALTAAHAAGIVHRDIKPENIMIRPDGYVKVLDFGLAKLVEQKNKSFLGLEESTARQTARGLILGTINYMSPEQAKGEEVDERTDIFSLGVVIHEMIAGKTPFAGDSMAETLANLINAEPQPLSDFVTNVPDEIQRTILRTLRKNKDERHQTMDDILANLKELRKNLTLDEILHKSHPDKGNTPSILQAATSHTNRQTSQTQYSFSQQIKRHKPLVAIGIVAFLLGAIGLGNWIAGGNRQKPGGVILSAPFASEKLSTNGKVHHAIISPNGKKVVYTNIGANDKQSIWLRDLESGSNIEIITASDKLYFGLAFSPDGNSLYFVHHPKGTELPTAIYRVSIFGGTPQRLVGDTQGWMSVSPDGSTISFVRCFYRDDEYCSLWTADSADGGNEKKLFSRTSPFRISANEFSPDGKLIAFASGQSRNAANEFSLMVIDVETGALRELTSEKFFDIRSLSWLPDQQSLLLTASRIPTKHFRIWRVSAAIGEVEPLTKDSETYLELSLDKTASRLVATKIKQDFRLRVFDFESASVSLAMADVPSVTFAPDGKLFYNSTTLGNDEIWSVNPDGSGQRQLTNDPADDREPIVAPDNSAIYFASNRTGSIHVWRMNPDGTHQAQVTHKTSGFPLAATLGEWLYFIHGIDRTLWRVSTRTGEEQLVLNKVRHGFALTPDGSLLSLVQNIGGEQFVAIVALADMQTVKAFKFAEPKGKLIEIAFLPDAKGLVYILTGNGLRQNNLWLQPFDAPQTPRKIADLGDEQISEGSGFALSPDGKSFAVAQGGWLHDAVLLKGFR